MKQILQSLLDGKTTVAVVPVPSMQREQVLISTSVSLVSAGTERMLADFGKANFLQKAHKQPDQLKAVLAKSKTDGLATTFHAVRTKLTQPVTLGYCNVGRILETSSHKWSHGERVVSNGSHAEIVAVSNQLCAKIPDSVSDEAASFTVLGAISLQGIRLAKPTLGECFTVIGLGLIGLLTVQILRAHGCRVLGIDYDPQRLTLAELFGAETLNPKYENSIPRAAAFSRGHGIDAVIITASNRSDQIIAQAAQMC